jgi:hypothetical protein
VASSVVSMCECAHMCDAFTRHTQNPADDARRPLRDAFALPEFEFFLSGMMCLLVWVRGVRSNLTYARAECKCTSGSKPGTLYLTSFNVCFRPQNAANASFVLSLKLIRRVEKV